MQAHKWRRFYGQQADDSNGGEAGGCLPGKGQFRAEVTGGVRAACEELESSKVRVLVRRCKTDLPQEAVEETLEKFPDLRGIYMANLSISGCCAAIQRAGKTGRAICRYCCGTICGTPWNLGNSRSKSIS